MKVRDIAAAVEEFAPLSLQEGWDNSGLCIGSPDQEVKSVLVGFDCTPELLDEAVETGADMVVTHHPLIFNGLKKISPDDSVGRTVIKAVSCGIAVYAAHTNADKVAGGVSGAMASRLGLSDVEILDPDGEGTGFGIVGNLPEPMRAEAFVAFVKKAFGLSAVRCSHLPEREISRVAMCGGSGSSFIGRARACGAQAYVSGDISYHHFFSPEDFLIVDIGHFEGEVDIVDILFSVIKKKFPTFAVRTSARLASGNPVLYF
ncbi:MAG: Nif3-like dinuclear metal center hexameric protein [Candidatus Cryptobacteroides sp.]